MFPLKYGRRHFSLRKNPPCQTLSKGWERSKNEAVQYAVFESFIVFDYSGYLSDGDIFVPEAILKVGDDCSVLKMVLILARKFFQKRWKADDREVFRDFCNLTRGGKLSQFEAPFKKDCQEV